MKDKNKKAKAMILSLRDSEVLQQNDDELVVKQVGGKAASLMKLYSIPKLSQHVPSGSALSVDFFEEWVDAVLVSQPYRDALTKLQESNSATTTTTTAELTDLCDKVKEFCQSLELSPEQQATINQLTKDMEQWNVPLAAVRSSAPEEDGTGASFAGAFETVLGVQPDNLLPAVRRCFASLFDYRVFSYISSSSNNNTTTETTTTKKKPGFAAVVMEMVDSHMAGVAFSVNPINSDLDELVVDCSYGLGESVVDGSVVADRYVYNKFDQTIVEVTIGSKQQEKRLDIVQGGQIIQDVTHERQQLKTLSDTQIDHLSSLVCTIEEEYGIPMDVEFAFMEENGGELKLLQARPITTAFSLDANMLTKPGEPRKLYYDFNIASEATTTEPFTHLDLALYNQMCAVLMGARGLKNLFPDDPEMMFFNASTRQYANLSLIFRWCTPEYFAKYMETLDPYLAKIFRSSDCDRKKYMAKKMPKEVNICNAWWFFKQVPLWQYYMNHFKYMKRPLEAKAEYQKLVQESYMKTEEVRVRGLDKNNGVGLQEHLSDLMEPLLPVFNEELAIMFAILPTFDKLEKQRHEATTEERRKDIEALCGGYEGDPLMEQNIAMYKLAQALPNDVWSDYDHSSFDKLAERIQANLDGKMNDLPADFLDQWKEFMKRFGYDGSPQLFVSAERYVENPEILLAKISHSAGDGIQDPAKVLEAKVQNRREAMAREEELAKQRWWWDPWALSRVQKQNTTLEHFMFVRNSPKMNMSYVMGMVREAALKLEVEMISQGQLEKPGDILHLSIDEIDNAIGGKKDSTEVDLMELVRPRRARYEQAKKATMCPMLIDSRNRILRADVNTADRKPGTLVGAAISPGVATGRVRIVHSPTEPFEKGEVLATIVTDPAWTPLFVGAEAVIFQIGGVLQHGALCAREYGKPGVSGIEVLTELKTGMLVSVDGNTGVVTILEEPDTGDGGEKQKEAASS